MYITHPSSAVRALLDRATIKGMESFLMGNSVRGGRWALLSCFVKIELLIPYRRKRITAFKAALLLILTTCTDHNSD